MIRIVVAFLLLAFPALGASHGTPWTNTGSPLGMNLLGVSAGTSEQPFLNVSKTGGGYFTINSGSDTSEEAYLYSFCLDANGYPTTLASPCPGTVTTHTFTSVAWQVMTGQAFYSGTWVFDYDNTGTFAIGKDGSAYTSCPITGHPNRHIFTSSGAGVGISISLTATGSGSNYAQNYRLTYAPTSTCGNGTTATEDPREASLYGGESFNPDFVAKINPFKVLRFMDWMATNNSTQSTWANRPPENWVFWDEGTSGAAVSPSAYTGVPLEVIAALCNEINADAWVNMPEQATDDYVTRWATLFHSSLTLGQHVYVEYANEVWNPIFSAYTYVGNQALATFAAGGGGTDGAFQWHGMRQAQIGTLWKAAWGSDSGRVINTLGVQGGIADVGFATDSGRILTTPLWTGTGVKLQFTGSISNGSSGAGTILDITAIASGSPAVGSPVLGVNADVNDATKITACPGGICGGTGNYTVNISQLVNSETMAGGGGAAPGGPAQPSFDAIHGAPYFGYNPSDAWTSSADGGVSQTFTEMFQGGLLGTGAANTFCTTGGTSTVYTAASNPPTCTTGSVACPPADQTTITVKFNQAAGVTPDLKVDGCANSIPIQAPPGTSAQSFIGANSVWNVSYMSGLNIWVLVNLGYSGGMLRQMNDVMACWTSYAAGLAEPLSACDYTTALSPSLPFNMYEGGQGFGGGDSTSFSLLTAVQTDPRMYQAYSQYYQSWETNGGQIANHFQDIGPWGSFGFWGSLNSVTQAGSAKYNSMLDFIRRNPCWWSGCRH